jgi:hypothetical protein
MDSMQGESIMLNCKQSLTCQLTSFRVEGDAVTHEWMAVATTVIFDETFIPRGLKDQTQSVSAGAVMRVFEGRGAHNTELGAMEAALYGLLQQVEHFRNGQ